MGYSILEMVMRRLREAGFTVSAAYPGQVFPQIDQLVAAVHIQKVERDELSVTIEISILCPAAMGGTVCETKALRATEVLRKSGAVCVQNGCSYDGIAQVYMVSILATYVGYTEEEKCVLWPGFYVYVDNALHKYAVSFTTDLDREVAADYTMNNADPKGFHSGRSLWKIQFEEQIPSGGVEIEDPEGPFEVRVISSEIVEVFHGCYWTTTHRLRDRNGLRRVRTGYALSREVS